MEAVVNFEIQEPMDYHREPALASISDPPRFTNKYDPWYRQNAQTVQRIAVSEVQVRGTRDENIDIKQNESASRPGQKLTEDQISVD